MKGEVAEAVSEQELLRKVVDNVAATLAYWDTNLRCRFANQAYEAWFGVRPDELVGKHISELLGPLYERTLPHMQAALRGEPQQFERELSVPSGGPSRHALVNYVPDMVGGTVRGFFVLAVDVTVLKQAELALRESEERFRLTIDEAPIGMALVAPDGRFMRVNHVLCEIVGYPPEELTRLTFQDITHPEDLDTDLTLAGQLARGEIPRYTLEKRYIRKDGAVVDILLSGSVLRGPDGRPRHFIAQIEDITERKRLEVELRLAEAKASGILAISADAIISIDEQQRITMFNKGAEAIFGYTAEEALGAPLSMLIPERFWGTHRGHVRQFSRGETTSRQMGERVRLVYGRRKNGQEFPADAAISRLQVADTTVLTVALRDISEQKRIESEQRFLAEVGPVLATTLDYEETLTKIAELAVRGLADLCIIDLVEEDGVKRFKVTSRDPEKAWLCERLAQVSLGRTQPHLLSRVLESLSPLLMQTPSADDIAAMSQNEQHLELLRAAEIRSLMAVPVLARARLLGAIAFVSSDRGRQYGPADLRLAEELARRAALSIENARLYSAAQRATQARDDVLGIVAHDLRNPLNVILMQARALQGRTALTEAQLEKAAAGISRAAYRMNHLIEDMLDVTRIEAGRLSVAPAREPVAQLLSEAVDAQRTLADASSLQLRLEAAPDLPDVWADRHRVLQVLDNLIGNALKFTEAGGTITVRAILYQGDVLFEVADTGCGIASEALPHVFDRFWQARKGERHGAGLGLPIARGIVEAHQGRMWVTSEAGRGTSFFFTLPTAPA